MNSVKIRKLRELGTEIENFNQCYKSLENQLWGDVDDCVSGDALLSFLIENPYFQDIANNIVKLEQATK